MKPEEIKLSDWHRIFVGQVPWEFYIEVIIRAAVVYLILMVSMRIMGKRMAGQLSRTEMIALVSLAAAVGIPIMTPDRGLLPGVISAFVIVVGELLLSRWAARNQRIESMVADDLNTLVEDHVLRLGDMEQTRVSRERLFAELRSEGLYHLGNVKRLYLEANGKFTLIQDPEPKPGLSVLPDWDSEFKNTQRKVPGLQVCTKCGYEKSASPDPKEECGNCGNVHWTEAVQ